MLECAAKGSGNRCVGPPVRKCARCGAVAYCSLSHQIAHWNHHKEECERLELQMKNADVLSNFPFDFCEEATTQIFEKQDTRCSFLAQRGLHQVGMWLYECSCGPTSFSSSNQRLITSWSLSGPSCPCKGPTSPLSKHLTCWKEYNEWRCIPLDSPVALLLHWPLTIYHAIQLVDFRKMNAEGSNKINIHYLGPEKELFQLAIFSELAALFPDQELHVYLIGPAVPQYRDGERITLDSYVKCDDMDCKCKMASENITSSAVTLRLLKGCYHDRFNELRKDSFPHLIIAPNAGIAAYSSWLPTVELIKGLKVPAVFSDFCEEAAHLAACCLSSVSGNPLAIPIQLNPFRQPMVVEESPIHLPCYSNCFLFGI